MHKLFFGILISVLVILALLVGLGALLTRILPLTLFQAAVLVTGASVATSLWLIMIACFIRTMRYLPRLLATIHGYNQNRQLIG